MRGGTPSLKRRRLIGECIEKGEIRVTSQQMLLNLGSPVVKFSVYNFESGQMEVIGLGKDRWEHLPLVARIVARLYEAIADDDTSVACDFEETVKRYRFIQEFESGERKAEPHL